ncbi:MAG: SoxR reducing system RseC family protein [Bacteroidales bacterium]|nr:SoxR reducing system RseC family protein [Bacteroidales bacterium]
MSNELDCISHTGLVEEITKDKIFVKILSTTSCASCNAKGMCNVTEVEEKTIEVLHDGKEYEINQHVTVIMDKKLGPQAVLLGYFYPFLVVLISLMILIPVVGHEGYAALISLSLLVPYYLALFRLKDKLKKKFYFRIQ